MVHYCPEAYLSAWWTFGLKPDCDRGTRLQNQQCTWHYHYRHVSWPWCSSSSCSWTEPLWISGIGPYGLDVFRVTESTVSKTLKSTQSTDSKQANHLLTSSVSSNVNGGQLTEATARRFRPGQKLETGTKDWRIKIISYIMHRTQKIILSHKLYNLYCNQFTKKVRYWVTIFR